MDAEELPETEAYRKFVHHLAPILTKGATVEVLIIRGHLLAEELLRQILKEHAPNPDALNDSRLSFQQVVKLASAFTLLSDYKELQSRLVLLNRMRNILAHEIDGDLNKQIARFIEMSIGELRKVPGWRRFGSTRRLGMAIVAACGQLSALCQVLELARSGSRRL